MGRSMQTFGKGIVVLTFALVLLFHPGAQGAQAVIPVLDLGLHVWAFEESVGCLLGGKLGDRWLNPKEAAGLLRGGEAYQLYTMTRFVGTATGSKPNKTEEPALPEFVVQMTTPSRVQREDILAIGGDWNALPRVPRLASTEQDIYKEAIAEVLRSKGMKNPKVKLTQVIRIDLDGDGVEEVLITADTYAKKLYSHLQKKGSYSLVLLRKLIHGKVENLIIEADFFRATPNHGVPMRYRVGAVLDVDGDGVMEIVLHGMYYEGGGTSVHRVEGDGVIKVLVAGWGV